MIFQIQNEHQNQNLGVLYVERIYSERYSAISEIYLYFYMYIYLYTDIRIYTHMQQNVGPNIHIYSHILISHDELELDSLYEARFSHESLAREEERESITIPTPIFTIFVFGYSSTSSFRVYITG